MNLTREDTGRDAGAHAMAAAPPPTRLIVVRHGHTAMTDARMCSGGGVPGPPLNASGRQDALQAAAALASAGAVAVVASPMIRTLQTAEVIATELGVEVHEDDDWRECDFGRWEGLTFTQVRERYPEAASRWLRFLSAAPPDGESLAEVADRVTRARDRVVGSHPERTVVVVTHSVVIRSLIHLTLEGAPVAIGRVQPAPGSITELHTGADGEWTLHSFGARP
ncbi:histidine phosphatase family protein [Kribbella shirazensis]|uniref:Broad specificity phosphatase PhoE n=1 Tax=Kribbella shirazensis TaxID=1105143 RepID=A0A7X5VHZ4_9ACTN|nr:histidine phosphatase family protein [Kribbella shirazensis]NIK61126.1 broad specificity phosphatase PhoE [Kribbella shirazensis]